MFSDRLANPSRSQFSRRRKETYHESIHLVLRQKKSLSYLSIALLSLKRVFRQTRRSILRSQFSRRKNEAYLESIPESILNSHRSYVHLVLQKENKLILQKSYPKEMLPLPLTPAPESQSKLVLIQSYPQEMLPLPLPPAPESPENILGSHRSVLRQDK